MKSTLLPIKQKSLGSEVLYFGPPIVIYELLSLWLGLPDVCRMDTSFCDQNMRRHFSFQLTAHRISFDGSFSWKSQSFLDWLIAKQVHVRQLFLVSCHTISSKSYQLWSNVVVINLLDCPMLGNSSFYSIISNAPKLTELQITNCPLINDESFSALAAMSYDSLPYLESLCISDCLSITDLGLEAFLLRHGQRLKTLSLNRCGGITGDSLICGLNAARHSLTSFYSKGCVSISQFSLVLKTLEDVISHRTSSDQVVMTDFLLLHKGKLNLSTAVPLINDSKPWVDLIQQRAGLNLVFRLLEKEGVEEFEICVINKPIAREQVQLIPTLCDVIKSRDEPRVDCDELVVPITN